MGAKKDITNPQQLNTAIIECLNELLRIGSSSKGDNFDETVRDKLKNHLIGGKYILTEQWCSKDKYSIFKEHYKRTLEENFDFTDLPKLIDNGQELNLMLVDKPNGSQKWPDLLIVFQGIGLPIEIKSSKADLILWNSGIPKEKSLYIYNCYGKSKTTCFLGEHAITEDERNFLLNKSKKSQEMNQKHTDQRWSYYVRDMFNSSQSYFENDELLKKCQKLQERIYELENEMKTLQANENKTKRMENKFISYTNLINKYSEEWMKIDDEHQIQISNRQRIEKQTIDYLMSINWTSSHQKTHFNLTFP